MPAILITVPLTLMQATFQLSQARQLTANTRQRDATIKWLEWHLGVLSKHGLLAPLHIVLTRLADDELTPEALRQHLESTRSGVESWLLQENLPLPLTWQYEQRVQEGKRNYLVEVRIEEGARSV